VARFTYKIIAKQSEVLENPDDELLGRINGHYFFKNVTRYVTVDDFTILHTKAANHWGGGGSIVVT
jgi:hypothetical protein